jgi:hypothetical protein
VRELLPLDIAEHRGDDCVPGAERIVSELDVTLAAVFALAVIDLLALLIAQYIKVALAS